MMQTTITTGVVIAFLCAVGWLIWKNTASNKNAPISHTVVVFTGSGGIIIAIASVILSTSYGFSMGGNHPYLPYIFACIFGSIAIMEFTAAFWIEYFTKRGNAELFMVCVAAMFVGILVSILAGQALIASQIENIKSARVQASDTYQSAVNQRETAAQRAQALAVSEADYQRAKADLSAANTEAQSLIQANITYSDCSAFPNAVCTAKQRFFTVTSKLNEALKPLRQRVIAANKTIQQYGDYKGALAHSQALQDAPLPAAQAVELPHVKYLSIVTDIPAAIIEAKLYLFLAVIAELFGLVMMYLYGKGKRSLETMKPAALQQPYGDLGNLDNAIPQAEIGAYVLDDGLVNVHKKEVILNADDTQTLQAVMTTAGVKTLQELLELLQRGVQRQDAQRRDVERHDVQRRDVEQHDVGKPQRVPKHLSKVGGKGRVSLIDECKYCGKDYTVTAWNKIYCSDLCKAKAHGFNSVDDMKRAISKRKK